MKRIYMLCVLSYALVCCAAHPERPACSELTLESIRADCQAKIEETCHGLTEAECNAKSDIIRQCDARIEEWQRCR